MAKKVVIIGGGASGLMAAIAAAGKGAQVTVVEHKDRVGKKLLMTGNGKCNLTNMSEIRGKYYGNDKERIYAIIEQFPAAAVRGFFQEIGLYTKEKRDGGVYPVSEQAACVLDALRTECERRRVTLMTDTEVLDFVTNQNGGTLFLEKTIREEMPSSSKAATKAKKGAVLRKEKSRLSYDSLILAAGGQAAAVSGSDGSGYQLAKKMGHHLIQPLPALVQLLCEGSYFKLVAGVRAQASLTLYIQGKVCAKEEGELQLTDYGISGIPVFQFSRLAARALYEQKNDIEVRIDFLPYLSEGDREKLRASKDKFAYKTIEEFLEGIVHKKLALLICRELNIRQNTSLKQISEETFVSCMDLLGSFPVKVKGTNSYEQAQVCSGGVLLEEIKDSMESVKCPHVYLAGELLDCDGICGGYNLQWAWTTGFLAGSHAAQEG